MIQNFVGKTAFITGGASGLGLSMGRAFGEKKMKVMLADIDEPKLTAAQSDLEEHGIEADYVVCDVTSRQSVIDAARRTVERFGKVHIVCNNAGVSLGGAVGAIKPADWDWIIDVNMKGPVYGVETFVPLILSHGEGGHIVNTASMAAFVAPPTMEPYCGTKAAVVMMSECWAAQLTPQGIGVSILCPGAVRTSIHESWRHKPQQYGGPQVSVTGGATPEEAAAIIMGGIDPDIVGRRVVEAIGAGELFIFTHPETREMTRHRLDRIMTAYDAADRSTFVVKE